MRWPVKEDKSRKWHKWFAWKPVKVRDENVWLETIIRRGRPQIKNKWWQPNTNWEYVNDEFELLKMEEDKKIYAQGDKAAGMVTQGPTVWAAAQSQGKSAFITNPCNEIFLKRPNNET